MRRRVEEMLDLLDIEPLRDRSVRDAVAAASASASRSPPRWRPARGSWCWTSRRSQLDPQAAEHVVAALQRLVHDQGMTVLLAEHRLERVAGFVDVALGFDDGRVDGRDAGRR